MALTQVSTGGIKNATIKNEDIEADTVQLTKLQNMATNHILGRSTSGTGNPEVLSAASVRSILNVADGATASSSTTINNNADNRVITGSGTANTLEGEADLTFDGTNLSIPEGIVHTGDTNTKIRFPTDDQISMEVAGSEVFKIVPDAGHGSTQSLRMMVTHTVDGARVNMGGTKAYSGGIIRGMANIRDGNAYNVTDNGGGIGFSAIYNTGGSHTTMSQIEGVKANNTDGNYEGALRFSTRHNLGNMVEKVRIGLNGLSFNGDTADANCLSDYEEGTFSATASAVGYSGGSAISMSGEQYTKIGRLVFFRMHLTVASSLSDGDLSISGLPFTASKDSVVNFAWQDAASFNGGQGIITGTQCVRFNGVFPTHHTGNATIRFSGTYNI